MLFALKYEVDLFSLLTPIMAIKQNRSK